MTVIHILLQPNPGQKTEELNWSWLPLHPSTTAKAATDIYMPFFFQMTLGTKQALEPCSTRVTFVAPRVGLQSYTPGGNIFNPRSGAAHALQGLHLILD